MKRMVMAMAISTVLTTAGWMVSDSAHAGRTGDRRALQHGRIDDGSATGQLTHGETHVLRAEQRAIRATKRSARSDGMVTAGERLRIERMQDRASADIYRLKHNGRTR
ncbi:MAG: hypothetical protein AB9873_04680 [Syntrophobacteraceae bacterium]